MFVFEMLWTLSEVVLSSPVSESGISHIVVVYYCEVPRLLWQTKEHELRKKLITFVAGMDYIESERDKRFANQSKVPAAKDS
jgi:hypothetical protein